MARFPGVGDDAPGFTLPGTGGQSYSLADYRGQPVVVVFYPGDNTPVCTSQLRAYSSDIRRFEEIGAQVLAISPQGIASHEEFSCAQGGFAFPLLADVDRAVGHAYDIVGPAGFYRRSVFVVDGAGVVRYAHRALSGLTYRPIDEILAGLPANLRQ
jgi:peroxiredoxin Q/BCP